MSHEPENASINEPPGSNLGGEPVAPPAAPVIEALDPDEAELGSADLILHVHGTGFTAESVIVFNGGDEVTDFVSETELTTGVKPSLVGAAIVVPVAVRNGETSSEEVEFEFLEPIADAVTRTSKRTKPPKKKAKK